MEASSKSCGSPSSFPMTLKNSVVNSTPYLQYILANGQTNHVVASARACIPSVSPEQSDKGEIRRSSMTYALVTSSTAPQPPQHVGDYRRYLISFSTPLIHFKLCTSRISTLLRVETPAKNVQRK